MTKKRIDNIYDNAITFDNVEEMWKIIKRTCKNKQEVYEFSLNKNTNLYNILYLLKNKRYKPYKYKLFLIFEPKPRLVMCETIKDKIINHFVANYYLLPYLESKLIDSNVATRKNKGSKYANDLIVKYINQIRLTNKNKEIYCLKLDISKYFYNIDHTILLNMIKRDIKDQDVINMIEAILNKTNESYINEEIKQLNDKYKTDIPYYKKDVGLSIGAMTSQFFAIYYLNDLDHYIKEKLKCKYYLRYMDDFIILDTNRSHLKEIWQKIDLEINKLNLKLNPKSNLYRLSNGLSFLGYKYLIKENKLLIKYRRKTISKIKKKLKYLNIHDIVNYFKSFASYYGYLSKVNKNLERRFTMKTKDKYDYYKAKFNNSIILIKEGSFYKTYNDDALIIWYLFNYKFKDNTISFGISPYSKVIEKLNFIGLGYVVISSNEECINVGDEEIYNLYLKLSNISYVKKKKKDELQYLFDEVIDNNLNSYEPLKKFLAELRGGI